MRKKWKKQSKHLKLQKKIRLKMKKRRQEMGQKVYPTGFRTGILYTWNSRWFAKKHDFASNLIEDHKIRQFLTENLKNAGVSKVEIERFFDKRTIIIHVSR